MKTPMLIPVPQDRIVKAEQLEVGVKYLLFNSLNIPGETTLVSIESGATFTVLPATEENTRNMPTEQGNYLILDFGGVMVMVDRKKLNTSYILKVKQQQGV